MTSPKDIKGKKIETSDFDFRQDHIYIWCGGLILLYVLIVFSTGSLQESDSFELLAW